MNKIFLPYEWVAVVIGSIALIVTFSNLLHIIHLSQFMRLILQSIIFLSLGIMTLRERKVLGISRCFVAFSFLSLRGRIIRI
ncbi:hypothetical protein [Staphylococcus chromogenes]|uniref:hypothetical protein n=1 Tax=Staphylococcus chromogenes TaxID=46126 RepID=UPI0034DB43B7